MSRRHHIDFAPPATIASCLEEASCGELDELRERRHCGRPASVLAIARANPAKVERFFGPKWRKNKDLECSPLLRAFASRAPHGPRLWQSRRDDEDDRVIAEGQ